MRPLPRGIYTPLPCFFKQNEDLGAYPPRAGMLPSNSHVDRSRKLCEPPQMRAQYQSSQALISLFLKDREERIELIRTARETLDRIGCSDVPIIAGVGGASTRESIKLARDAAEAGADYGMVNPPGYYAGALIANRDSIKSFFVDIAEASELPIIIYNFPAVSGGVDMDSDLVVDIIKGSPNICGIKLTCANVGKLTRILAEANSPEFKAKYPRRTDDLEFTAIDGFIDFILPSVAVGAGGAISGLPNFAPKACVKLWDLCQSHDTAKEALELQQLISLADRVQLKMGIHGMKKLLNRQFGHGYSAVSRRPLPTMSDELADSMFADPYLQKLLQLEATL
ncbi:dihydrodipicolinate synthetase [Colletotrichum kahawae]|uniref:Dihydrodipicolinate synthetase n=1 Tax=Colletotrichum kahawae TaxID=34407 RepID=A0AAE0DFN1_COLKA|nr:dihydrodipicolinate synthetase [Colletotrichum kahawae]